MCSEPIYGLESCDPGFVIFWIISPRYPIVMFLNSQLVTHSEPIYLRVARHNIIGVGGYILPLTQLKDCEVSYKECARISISMSIKENE